MRYRPRDVREVFLLKSTNSSFLRLHQIEWNPALSRSSASMLPGAGGDCACKTVDGPAGERGTLRGTVKATAWLPQGELKDTPVNLKKKGKLPINSTMRDNLMKRFHFS